MNNEMRTRHVATAVISPNFDVPEMVVQPQHVEYEDGEEVYWSTLDEIIDQRPLTRDPATEVVVEDFDQVLEAMGWRRVEEQWETFDYGACAVVERLS